MRQLGSAGLLAAVCLILGLLGPLDVVPERVGIVMALAAWGTGRAGAPGLAILAVAPLLPATSTVDLRLAGLAVIALAIPSSSRRADAGFVASILGGRLLVAGVPWLWMWGVEVSRLASGVVGRATGQDLDLGPTASGLYLYVVFLAWAAAARHRGGERRIVRRLAWGTLALVAFMAALPLAASSSGILLDAGAPLNLAGEHLSQRPERLARLMFGFSAMLFAALCLLWLPRARPAPEVDPPRRNAPVPRIAAVVAGVFVAASLIAAGGPAGDRRPGEILILKSPAFDMETPVPGRFGAGHAGMFGMLPGYLALDGHRTRVHAGPLSESALGGVSVLIVALPVAPFEERELRAVEAFVAAGGSLLALGDHTDLMGTMDPMNRLLAPWGMGLRFDSAFPAVRGWRGCVEGPGIHRHTPTGTGTGASLRVEAGVRPLIVGRYALSDAGDRGNTGRGAFLGDYAYQPGEPLSDLVVAARTIDRRGQVAAFGDTSAFQNLMLPFSYPHVAALMDGLSRPAPRSSDLWRIAAGVAAALLAVPALLGSRAAAAALGASVIAGHLAPAAVWRDPGPLERLPQDASVAFVDAGHLNRFSVELWRDDSIGGLIVNLERDGYLPLVVRDGFARRRIAPDHLVVLPAARSPLTRRESRALSGHLERGGSVLVAAGAAEAAAVDPLLSRYGVRIDPLPLGPVPVRPDMDRAAYEAARKEPQFREAWPLAADARAPWTPLYRAFDRDVAIRVTPAGSKGRLLVIGDPTFLTDRVLENETTAWEGNVTFLARILSREGAP